MKASILLLALIHSPMLADQHSLGLRSLGYLHALLAYSSIESCASSIASTSPPLLVLWLANLLIFNLSLTPVLDQV